ncbi:MAG: YhdH/YhfP family quinone oxidoreductase [Oceanococcaceae bacterium]
MSTIRVWEVAAKGEGANYKEREALPLAAGQVRVRVEASSLNFKDALAVTGKGRIMRTFPCVAGIDLAGTVAESAEADWPVGTPVLVTGCNIGEQFDGGLAQETVVAAASLVRRPEGVSAQAAMALGTAGFTAGLAVMRMLDNGQSPEMGPIAVTGATGGVGSVAIAILSKLGYEVVAVTSKMDQEGYLKSLGASSLHNAREIEAAAAPLLKARWGGVIDNVGGTVLSTLVAETQLWGNVASIGLAASHKLETTVMPFILRGVNLLGIHSVETPMPRRLAVWDKLFGDWACDPALWTKATIPLAEVGTACEQLMAGGVTGRFVVDCQAGV